MANENEPIDEGPRSFARFQQRGEELARKEQEYEAWRAEKAAQQREWRDEDEGFRDTISRLSDEVAAGQEWQEPLLARMEQGAAASETS